MEPNSATKLGVIGFLLAACLVEYSTGAADMCNASIAECNEEGELLMETEEIRRMMAEVQTHITYGALKKDLPACTSSERGQSYSSCYPDPSNPYTRGCSKIYRCRGGS